MLGIYFYTALVVFVLGLAFFIFSVSEFKDSLSILNEKKEDEDKSLYQQRHLNTSYEQIEEWVESERRFVKYGLFSMLFAPLWPIILFGAIPACIVWWLGGKFKEGVQIVIEGK